ncbi:putative NDR1/HIN1-like protein 10 [Cocos nucifera]|uniref:Putative NDR1/HIN1-like protein 10 n=1 Tax=Cocos nucifera TaxID=13894 RepID=A0A8K0I203_COCNU|nr:putative NDR1/HIN1-like protein 10 [Cocos nucifera]
MDAQNPQPFEIIEAHYPGSKETHNPSFPPGKWCCVLSSLLLSLAILTAAILVIIFVLKPKKPIFHLHAIQLGSFKLDATSSKEGNDSSSVLSMLFVTQNPNKFGIRYSSSALGILFEGNPIGIIEVPTFYQPSHSRNETVLMHVLFKQLNISRFISGELMNSSSDGYHIEIRVIGGILAQPHVSNFSLPKIKLSLDCRISINYGAFALSRGLSSLKSDKVLLISNFPHLSQKCSLALCI